MASSACACLCLALASCITSVAKWTYPSGRYATTTSARPAVATIAVQPFTDLRGSRNYSAMTFWYIPFCPAGWAHFDRPEAKSPEALIYSYSANPPEDLARSLVVELERERIVTDAVYALDYDVPPNATHVLRGRVQAFYVAETRWSYGISAYSYLLWVLGMPMGTSQNGFCVDLELADARDGHVVWQARVFDDDKYTEGIYYGPEWFRFNWMWERRLRAALGDLALALGAEPPPKPEELERELKEPPRVPDTLGVVEVAR